MVDTECGTLDSVHGEGEQPRESGQPWDSP
jgi:hypothetical protein